MVWILPEQCSFLNPNLVRKQLCIWSMKIWYSIELTNRCFTMNISCYLIILLTSHSWQYSASWSSRCLKEVDMICYFILDYSFWRSGNSRKAMVSSGTENNCFTQILQIAAQNLGPLFGQILPRHGGKNELTGEFLSRYELFWLPLRDESTILTGCVLLDHLPIQIWSWSGVCTVCLVFQSPRAQELCQL